LRLVVAADEEEVEAVGDIASPAVALLQAALYGASDQRPVNVISIGAACKIIAVLIVEIGRVIAVNIVATCRIIAMTGLMMYRTRARRDARIGRTTGMMCAMTDATGMMTITVTVGMSA
jgi:hypothetical protein